MTARRLGWAARLGIAAVLAGAAAASAPPAPRAGPDFERGVAASCTPGHAERAARYMKVDGNDLSDARLKPGDWITTGPLGKARVCLQQGSVECGVRPNSTIQVLPKHAPDVIMQAPPGRRVHVWCKATTTGKRKKIKVGGETITLGALGLTPPQRDRTLAGYARGTSTGHLFSLDVTGKKTIMKVRRGATVVAPRKDIRRGVVLGRNQQVAAKTGKAPDEPKPIALTPEERAGLDQLAQLLPKDRDTTPPTPSVVGSTQKSSLRSPTFRFSASETGAVFSCSLDNQKDFHVCIDGQPFGHLAVGSHVMFVKATDAAGNTTKRAKRYPWSIKQNPIVYARGPAGGDTEIWRMDSDGTNQQQLTNDAAHARTPEWSPDHSQIAFDSDVAGNYDIYVMDANGKNRRAVANDAVDERNPTWSPNGKEIAFERGPSGARDIYVMSVDGGKPQRLTSNLADDLDPSWSPDGNTIAFASTRGDNYDIWVIDAKGGNPTDLTNTPDATEFGPAWSPNGAQIAFHRKIDRPVPIPNDIYVMKPDGSKVEKITQTRWDDFYPSWAPDGREIVFYTSRSAESTDADVYFVSLDVKIETRLTTDSEYDYLPDW